jgi:serine/threonine protein kinase
MLQASDVYSFGVLVWELYCGQRAWDGLSGFQITYAVLWNNQTLQFPEDAPVALRELACSCLNPLPEARPSIDEVVERLYDMSA